ncbi:MAG: WD40/YVTN/BNR-like repeat-containing protein [Candidatus Aminicenantaceae bacterium]
MKKSIPIPCVVSLSILLLAPTVFLHPQIEKPVMGPEARMKSWEQHMKLKAVSPYKDLKWRAAGPEFMGGRVETIACHPDDPFTIYVGAGSGNLWKTVNHGTTWDPIFDDQPVFAMGCVAIAPSDPNVLWAGTGEVLMARSSYAGLGVFKSADAGKTWRHMGLEGAYHVPRIVIDPEDPDIVYAAALGRNYTYNEERGVYKTTNGGKTWEKILYISERIGVVELVMDPSDNQTLYAVTWERDRKAWNNVIAGKGSGIYKTIDGGKNWKRLSNGIPVHDYVGRFGLAIAPTNPDVLYAILDNQKPDAAQRRGTVGGELYRSDNKGEKWVKTHSGSFPTGIGYDFCLVRVSPDNENEVFVPGWKLIHSKDGGKTFEFTGDTVVHILSHDSRVMHLDMHELWIDPGNPDRLLLGNDGGFYCSWDRGQTWLHYNNFPIGEFYAVSVDDADPYNIYGGTQDNAALYGPGNHNVEDRLTEFGVEDPWKHVYLDRWGGGDSYFTEVDPVNPDVIYYEHQFGVLRRKNMRTGETTSIQPRAKEGEESYRYNWMTPFIISQHDPSTIYYGAHKMFKSNDRGDNWEVISPDLTTNPGPERQGNVPFGTITSISESPFKQGLIYVGTDDGNVQVTENDGVTWRKLNNNLNLPEKWVSRVRASRHDVNTAYVTFTGYRDDDFQTYIYMSTDGGTSWKSIAGNLPPEPVNVIVEDPRNADIIYIGTDLSAYVTLNRGGEWISLSNHLPTCAVYDLVIQDRELDLVAGTHGRSVFVLDIEEIGK